jgi:hypothetical protein
MVRAPTDFHSPEDYEAYISHQSEVQYQPDEGELPEGELLEDLNQMASDHDRATEIQLQQYFGDLLARIDIDPPALQG